MGFPMPAETTPPQRLRVEVVDASSVQASHSPTWVLVVDVLRATTTLQRALEHGAAGVLPVADLEAAHRVAGELGREQVILCGERDGVAQPGFDRGNSPLEMSGALVKGKPVVLTTTNGTTALDAALRATREFGNVMTACFPNRAAVARGLWKQAARADGPLQIQICCAGRRGGSGEDDELFAAGLLHALRREAGSAELELGDRARSLAPRWSERLEDSDRLYEELLETEAGAWLESLGFESDVRACARLDEASSVPVLREERIAGRVRPVLRLKDASNLGSGPPGAPKAAQ